MSALERVQQFVEQYSDLEIILFNSSTHTAELAAETLGVAVAQIAKTLAFVADGQPFLLVTCGDRRVDTKRLAKTLGVRKVKFADTALVESVFGFSPGGVSPVGLLNPAPIYLDKSLYDFDIVYAAAGTANSALPIQAERLREVTSGKVIDVC